MNAIDSAPFLIFQILDCKVCGKTEGTAIPSDEERVSTAEREVQKHHIPPGFHFPCRTAFKCFMMLAVGPEVPLCPIEEHHWRGGLECTAYCCSSLQMVSVLG